MVYGNVASNAANDGNGTDTNSLEYDIRQSVAGGATSGYADWVTDAQ